MITNVQETQLYKWLVEKNSKFVGQIDEAAKYAEDMLPLINRVFSDYTVHGIKHSINVMEYMFSLITNIDLLSELEVTLLIYSALFHDIGMVTSENEIHDIMADNFVMGTRKYSKVFEKYGEENDSLQECIRPIHGKRSREHINHMDEKLFLIPDSSSVTFRDELGLICMSHNEDFEWIEKELVNQSTKGIFEINAQYIAVLLRIADYLDIDEQRAPLYLYKYLQPKEFGDLEWKQHFVIQNFDKVFVNKKTGLKEIIFEGTSQDPSVHRKLLKYFDSVNGELRNAVRLCERFSGTKYLMPLKTSVINKIQTKNFSFSDLRLSLDYNAVTNLLMGENIYGNKKYGLRELIQNSIDACKTMEESSLQMEEYRYQKYQPFISLCLDKDRKQVVLKDNGSGMSIEILKKYFLNVGVSYYASDDYLLQGRKYSPIGHYGIGFLACFMLSDKVELKTVHYQDHKVNRIAFEKNSEYICLTYENEPRQPGTEIILDYDQFMEAFDDKIENVVTFVESSFLDMNIPIRILFVEKGISSSIDCIVKKIEQVIPESICLNDYLEGIEAYIDFTYKQINFATQLQDLNGCSSFYYNDDCVLNEERRFPITNCVTNGKIRLMNIPIISEHIKNDFLKAYEVLEDYEEALDRLGYYESINLWAEEIEFAGYALCLNEDYESIIGQYTLKNFREQFYHASSIPVQTTYVEVDVVSNNSNMVLPYNESCTVVRRFHENYIDSCFIKNVYLRGLKIKIPYLADGIILKNLVINITNPEFTPNVSRSNISEHQQEKLSFAIGKALHLWIRDNVSLTSEELELLNLFIELKYGSTNYCLKSY